MFLSPDEKYIVIGYSGTKKYLKTSYRIFDRKTSTFKNINPTNDDDKYINFLTWNSVDSDFVIVFKKKKI